MANLRIESAMRASVSDMCDMGVGGTAVRSVGFSGVSGEAERGRLVVIGRWLHGVSVSYSNGRAYCWSAHTIRVLVESCVDILGRGGRGTELLDEDAWPLKPSLKSDVVCKMWEAIVSQV